MTTRVQQGGSLTATEKRLRAERDNARNFAVQYENETREAKEQIAGALAFARRIPCICDPMDLPDICDPCSVVAHLELPGMGHFYEAPF